MILEGLLYVTLFVLGVFGGILLAVYIGLVTFLVAVVLLVGSIICLFENAWQWGSSKLRRWYGRGG